VNNSGCRIEVDVGIQDARNTLEMPFDAPDALATRHAGHV
jgi:hypothetical protein